MDKDFETPDFDGRILELRYEDGEICIYGSKEGLKRLAEFCQTLVEKPQHGHIHLEDYEVLTEDSLKGTVAVFPSKQEGEV